MNAADYLYQQLMEAHAKIRTFENQIKGFENYLKMKKQMEVKPKRGRGRPRKVQS